MKRLFLFVFLMMLGVNSIDAQSNAIYGDVNGDTQVSMNDVISILNIILENGDPASNLSADINKDGNVTVADMVQLIGIIIGGNNHSDRMLVLWFKDGTKAGYLLDENVKTTFTSETLDITTDNKTVSYPLSEISRYTYETGDASYDNTNFSSSVQSTNSYEYFIINFTDGTKSEAFYTTDVDHITYSKTGLDGIEYDNWQVQEIHTLDRIYRYSLASISDVHYKQFNIEKKASEIAVVSAEIVPFFLESTSANELYKKVAGLKIDGVEGAWVNGQTLFVKIRDWNTIMFTYPIIGNGESDSRIEDLISSNAKTRSEANIEESHNFIEAHKACIANQTYNDENPIRNRCRNMVRTLKKSFNAMGIECDINNNPSPDFFSKDMFEYDLVFLITHGGFDGEKHWLVTGEEIVHFENDEDIKTAKQKAVDFMDRIKLKYGSRYLTEEICFDYVVEKRDNKWVAVLYTCISEDYIHHSPEKFKNNTIFFNTACESLMGDNQTGAGFSLGSIILNKGAGFYAGYTEENSVGDIAGEFFFLYLLNGKSTGAAFKNIPYEYSVEQWYEDGNIIKSELKAGDNDLLCITHPNTQLYIKEEQVLVNGNIRLLSTANLGNQYGFQYSTNPDMSDAKDEKADANYYDEATLYMNWEKTLDTSTLQPNTTYYYRAYMNDGLSNCYGEIKSFTTKDDNAEAYYVWDEANKTATYYYDGMRESRGGESNSIISMSDQYTIRDKVIKVIFDTSFSHYYPNFFSFSYCQNLECIDNISYLNTDSIKSMADMFRGCRSLTNLNLTSFNTSNVTDMGRMFLGCSSLTRLDLSSFNTSNLRWGLDATFLGCSSLQTLNLGFFSIKSSSQLFEGCESLEKINIKSLVLIGSGGSRLFYELKSLKYLNIDNVNTKEATSMKEMFYGCSSLTSVDLSNFDTFNVTNMYSVFMGCESLKSLDVSHINTSNVTDMSFMFAECHSLTSLDFTNTDTSNVMDMRYMFAGCHSLTDLDVSKFNTSNVTEMKGLFAQCSSLTSLDLSSFNTINVTNMGHMFRECSALTNLELSSFNTSNVTDMNSMFENCSSLTSLILNSFNTSNVTDMTRMFYGCSSLTSLDLSSFNGEKVGMYKFDGVFYDCSSLTSIDLSGFGKGAYPSFIGMCLFYNCSSLNVIYVPKNWKFDSWTKEGDVFYNCHNLRGGQGTKIGDNLYGYDENGNPLYYQCGYGRDAARVDRGKEYPGLFTAK